ncbi:MAG: UDP-3-O-(3-hydroxymyristoyl)glucosamine N-acyltransferase [Sulfurimonas sp. RIFOXYD12_FULL_33_39]|uniref:UDP-3-O-(3-hydroxymyristoyl)glucosamine N-acyltransferase n=1 Tax=unclassified Sulfurimonas TaxID=2623549 RepID=UPI0008AB6D03|nr:MULTISPECIES: UDP-3-O-(3-hydroxymyristoyl)glucosamine N-acyltransferase [unclassified Sulfurimonas]OHE09324.1 MAG: UDP-3-O-(3-hydroxymyristoyl)glucosamine N-acyltransferase [Sulfurimonas sp. RIFOXYD12_FULL_33_39]OHE12893.1 MAG: UDP-3-O-(3-hydroxymyristoyl)glucosamine N-acyltransferase [Sulfurimonas sp. RIFOXYD2_FULL_34_21]DAB27303.1 MAG TPA: UDP-3-O-(3-hydroxymyristoyl)glucosamine N-acyltransferase [Sulfurimonas sp. UBA10385]
MDLKEIAKIIGCEFSRDSFEVNRLNTLKDAKHDEISFVASSKYVKDIQSSKAGAIIVDKSTKEYVPNGSIALVVDNPYWAMATISKYFAPPIEDNTLVEAQMGEGSVVSLKAEIAKGATIGKNCTIMAHVYIGTNAVVGDNTVLYPSVTVYRDCKIGNNCIIHANTTIGSDGFGFATNKLGEHRKIYQNGNVEIEDNVEIGSSTTIDRAAFGTTLIKHGVRIDNLVQVGHNCVIGEHSVLVAQAGISGSTTMGRNVVMGGQSATAGHLSIAPFTTMAARSGVTKSITQSGLTFAGFPLMEHKIWLKLQAKIARLIK